MTYLQFMIKCLTFCKNQKEEFDSYNFYFHWLCNEDKDIDLYYKSKAKKAIMYLVLIETKKYAKTNDSLLNLLEKDLSYFDVSLSKTIEQAEENTITSINEDTYMFDQICLLEQDELTKEEQKEIIEDIFNEFKNQLPDTWKIQQYESAIHNVMEMVSQIIPELFFTEVGYQYIDKEYQIDDVKLRERCYEYLKENIKYYNSNRIYKVDENIYRELYNLREELDEENLFPDEDEIRGQVDIYGEDNDNYDILYYSVTLLVVMLKYIKNKQYDKITKLIEIDEAMTNFHDGYGFYYDKTLIESLYQPKAMGQDYHKEILTPAKSDFYLNFFLSDNDFTKQYNIKQLSLIIAHCFDLFDSKPINKIIKNSNVINNIFNTTNLNSDENIKRLVKIKKDNN